MRQNRDIARANSAQSLRIRNLENETSRLLAENLNFREQVLQLQNELQNGKSQRLADHTGAIKLQLEEKLLEIGALLAGLGGTSALKRQPARVRKVSRASPRKSPNERTWKNLCTLSEAVASQEGRLSPILENKSYPWKTLESDSPSWLLCGGIKLTFCRRQELANVITDAAADTTDSPEIGPPPVSQFVDDEDPVKINLPIRPRKSGTEEVSDRDPTLSVSIEQRRKRRDSSVSSESRRSSKIETTTVKKENTVSLKTGAKRKLGARDGEEHAIVAKLDESSNDGFEFTRVAHGDKARTVPQAERSGSRVARELAIARGGTRPQQCDTAAPSSRKVLAAKSVNDSPKKRSGAPIYDGLEAAKRETPMEMSKKDLSCDTRKDPPSIKPTIADLLLQTVELQPAPATPLGLELLSPPSSQTSACRNESRDTPPPPDLGPGADGQRPSRRARSSVSYAEPNLRDKMRRPTKELVDAVIPGTSSLRAIIMKSEADDFASSVRIKSEPEANDAWKRMPITHHTTVENSPLRGKMAIPESLSSSLTMDKRRGEYIMEENDFLPTTFVRGAAIVLVGNERFEGGGREEPIENESKASKNSTSHENYDLRGCSPTAVESADAANLAKEEKPISRFSRRNSSVARTIPSVYESENSEPERLKNSDLPKSRRRQSTLGLRSSSSSAIAESSKDDEAETIVEKTSSSTAMSESGSNAARSERLSARRRSMML